MDKKSRVFVDLFGAESMESLLRYEREFVKWNKKFSLTSVPEKEIFARLIAPSAWLGMRYAEEGFSGTCADFGTGPGIPGLPMAIMNPAGRYILIDSHGKKTTFVKHCVTALGLANVTVMNIRFGAAADVEPVDRLTSRAAGSMAEVLGLWEGALHPGGVADFFKGSDADEEIKIMRDAKLAWRVEIMETPGWFDDLKIARVMPKYD